VHVGSHGNDGNGKCLETELGITNMLAEVRSC